MQIGNFSRMSVSLTPTPTVSLDWFLCNRLYPARMCCVGYLFM